MRRIGFMIACAAMLLTAGFLPATAKEGRTAAPLSAQDLDPDALDAARRYYAMPSMQGLSAARHAPRAIAHQFEKTLPEGYMTGDQRDAFIAMVIDEFSGMKAEHDETAIRVLAHVYTAEELDALIAFEQTEVGRRIAEKRPVYSILIKEATGSLRRDALARIMTRLTGIQPQAEQ